jgi:hypothetical protein
MHQPILIGRYCTVKLSECMKASSSYDAINRVRILGFPLAKLP